MATHDFHGEVRAPCPLCLRLGPNKHTGTEVSAHIRVFIFYLFYFARPGQFTISADTKGKDSMILFKIKETAHINSGHVLLGQIIYQIASRGRFVPVFLLGNKWQLMIFMGRSGPPAPSVSASDPINILGPRSPAHIRVFIFYLFYFARPGQFTISADTKGKDSMILFKIKETAHINSGHVLF